MKITKALAAYAAESLGLDRKHLSDIRSTESAAAIQECVTKAIVAGTLEADKFAELQKADDAEAEDRVRKMISESMAEAVAPMTAMFGTLNETLKGLATKSTEAAPAEETDTEETPAASTASEKSAKGAAAQPESKGFGSDGKAKALLSGAAGGSGDADEPQYRVKKAIERYSSDKKSFENPRGVPLQLKGDAKSGMANRTIDGYSDGDLAISGAVMKWLVTRQATVDGKPVPAQFKMTEHDRHLVEYAAHEKEWVGPVGMREEDGDSADYGWAKGGRLNDVQVKAVLDDATSGGLEAVPAVFDSIAILTPLLTGELFPHVDHRVTTRRRIEGFTMDNPTMSWTAEGSTPPEFNTAGFIAGFDTDIKPCIGWMEVGLDFEADAPVDMGNLILGRYGLRAKKELDDVIADGNGTTQPLGIANTVGLTSVSLANASTGPITVSDYENLHFAIPKEFRTESGAKFAFLSNDVNYKRSRGIAVGTSDQRRIYGMNYSSYNLMDERYAINGEIANTDIYAVMLNRYVMYRRAGFSVRRITEDSTLAKTNKALYVFRMRFGGQMTHALAVAGATNGQA